MHRVSRLLSLCNRNKFLLLEVVSDVVVLAIVKEQGHEDGV